LRSSVLRSPISPQQVNGDNGVPYRLTNGPLLTVHDLATVALVVSFALMIIDARLIIDAWSVK
jgi:hypothetical protein